MNLEKTKGVSHPEHTEEEPEEEAEGEKESGV